MLRVAVGFMCVAALVCVVDAARADSSGLFHQSLVLAEGQRLVVEENSLEPRSIGSYTVRLYSGSNPDFPYDDFVKGLVLGRDGTVETVRLQPGGEQGQMVHILLPNVGSGGYLSRHSLRVRRAGIDVVDVQSGLPPDYEFDP